jgi:hypothetical protein
MKSTNEQSLLVEAPVAEQKAAVPPLVTQMFAGTWPDKAAVEQLNQERLYQRGIEAYMLSLPILNTIGMRDGSEGTFGKGLQRAADLEGSDERQNVGAHAELRRYLFDGAISTSKRLGRSSFMLRRT